jgi:hypothetical protein
MITRRLSMKYGSEGSRHDPYAYQEQVMVIDNGLGDGVVTITLHEGLGQWIRVVSPKDTVTVDGEETIVEAMFTQCTGGVTPAMFQKAYYHVHGPKRRCTKCGSKRLTWVDGYPGETLQQCTRCDEILFTMFNVSEVL